MLNNIFSNKIYFFLPGLYQNLKLNLFFINLSKNNREVFIKNHFISAVYGSFPYSIFSLDRNLKCLQKKNILTVLNFYQKHNISINYDFDNGYITKDDLNDTFCNMLLETAADKNNSVSVSSELLYEHIIHKYPQYTVYKIINDLSSKSSCLKKLQLDEKLNNNFDFNLIKRPGDTLITLNPICPADCKYLDLHKEYTSKEQLGFYKAEPHFICNLKYNLSFYNILKNKNCISLEQLKIYTKHGFNKFKISSNNINKRVNIRYSSADILESYLYYLIKPECKDDIRKEALQKIVRRNKKDKDE